jgi:hypothetical protein
MRLIFLLLIICLASCREQRTAVSCAPMGNSANQGAKEKKRERHLFKHRTKTKAEYRFRRKENRYESHGEKAEKGEKKAREKTKAEKRIGLFRKKRRDKTEAQDQNKGVFKNNEKKHRKRVKKSIKHPQEGLFPKGGPGK